MNVACPSCNTRYSVEDGRIPATGVTIKCPKCTHSFVVKKDGAPPRGESVVPLPGQASAGSRGAPVPLPGAGGKGAVPLPGSGGRKSADDGEIDLGLDDDAPPPQKAKPAPPKASSKGASAKPVAQSGMLDFIDEFSQRTGVEGGRETDVEYRVRRLGGALEGPYGVPRIIALLRAGDLQGLEEVSEDGRTFKKMKAHPEFAKVIQEIAQGGGGLFSDLPGLPDAHKNLPGLRDPHRDLPGLANLPAPADPHRNLPRPADKLRNLPAPADPNRNLPAPVAADGMGDLQGNAFDLGLEADDPPPAMGGPPMGGPAMGGPAMGGPAMGGPAMGGPAMGGGPMGGPMDGAGAVGPMGLESGPLGLDGETEDGAGGHGAKAKGAIDPNLLQIGEVPELPNVWQEYKKQIVGFAAIFTFFTGGIVTELWTDYGFWFWRNIFTPGESTRVVVAPPPPPPPPKIVDFKEIQSLIDEGSFEAFRSVLATIEALGLSVPDNAIAYGKTKTFAHLAYGEKHHPLAGAKSAVEALAAIDPKSAYGGDSARGQREILKAKAALEIAQNSANLVEEELARSFDKYTDDKELAYLLGLARFKLGDKKGALKALDRAVVIDPAYGVAISGIADVLASDPDPSPPTEVAIWYEKAATAQPKLSQAALKAATIYQSLKRPGDARRLLAQAADFCDRGLPPEERAAISFEAAKSFDEVDRTADGLKYATEASRLEPNNADYVALGGLAQARSGKVAEGLQSISNVIAFYSKEKTRPIAPYLARSQVYFGNNEVAPAFQDLDEAKKIEARNFKIYLLEGRYHRKLAKLGDARDSLNTAVSLLDPSHKSPLPYLELAQLELEEGNITVTFDHAQAAVEADPSSAPAHTLLAECHRLRDQLTRAEAEFAKARELDPMSIEATLGMASTLRDMASATRKPIESEHLSRAIPFFLEALRLGPESPVVFFEYGKALEIQKRVGEAVQLYRDAATLDPKDPRPHLAVVSAYLDTDLDEAREALNHAKTISPARPDVNFWKGRVAMAEARYDEAATAFEAALQVESRNANYHFWLGQVLEARDLLVEAVGEYKLAVQLNNGFSEAYRALGRTSMASHKYAEAREFFGEYQKTRPEDYSIWAEVGRSWSDQNQDENALAAFMKVLEANPKHSASLLAVGNIYSRRSKDKDAIDYFRRASTSDSKNAEAFCKLGISLGNSAATPKKMNKDAKIALHKCVTLDNSPGDLKGQAQEMLDLAGG